MKRTLLILGLVFPPNVFAFTLTFDCITYNSGDDCAIGEAQFSVKSTKLDTDKVLFTFFNQGLNESFISNIYISDTSIIDSPYLVDADDGVGGDPNVDFLIGSNPANLPGSNSLSDPLISGIAFSNEHGASNGIHISESLEILFMLTSGSSYDDLLNSVTDGTFRIGIHSQGFYGGGSESFVSKISPVPIPFTVWFFLSALCALFGVGARNKVNFNEK